MTWLVQPVNVEFVFTTVLVKNPNGVTAGVDDFTPLATVEGDGLTELNCNCLNCHACIIADRALIASSKCVYCDFFFFFIYLTRKSLSINELRRRGTAFVVSP